jgi:hypothetical protein
LIAQYGPTGWEGGQGRKTSTGKSFLINKSMLCLTGAGMGTSEKEEHVTPSRSPVSKFKGRTCIYFQTKLITQISSE